MRRYLLLSLLTVAALQLGSFAQADDKTQNHSKDGTPVKHVGTADDSASSERDPQGTANSNVSRQEEESDGVFHGHPSTGPTGKISWTR